MSMARTLMILALSLSLSGCNGAFWGNLVVLAMTVGIFVGTLSLGRAGAEATRSADRSNSPTASQS